MNIFLPPSLSLSLSLSGASKITRLVVGRRLKEVR
jgi:hypothetical protein